MFLILVADANEDFLPVTILNGGKWGGVRKQKALKNNIFVA